MNRSSLSPVALAAISYSTSSASTAPKKLTAYTDYNGTGLAKLSIDNESTDAGAKKPDGTDIKTDNTNVISNVDGGGEQTQQQAQAENTQSPGAETLSADKKVDEAGTGQVKAIGDPPADASSQLG